MKTPSNKGLEREAMIASFQLRGADRAELLTKIKPEFIDDRTTRRLYEISAEDGCSPRVAYDKLWSEDGRLDQRLSQQDFMELVGTPIDSPYPISDVSKQLRQLWARRRVLELARGALDQGGSIDLNRYVEELSRVAVRQEGATYNDRPAEVFDSVLHRAAVGPDESESGGFGIEALDKTTRGLRRTDLVVVGAPPNTGKTPFVLDIQRKRARMGHGHQLVISREMDKEDIVREIIAMDSGIPLDILLNGATGDLKNEVLRRVSDTGEWVEKEFSIIDPKVGDINRTTFRAIVNKKLAELRSKGRKLDSISVDYLQLFVTGEEHEVKELTDWTRMLKLMALELSIPIFLISNLNNGYDRRLEQIKPEESYVKGSRADFRGSGNIVYDASKVIFLLQHYDGKEMVQGKLWAQVMKNKHGLKGKVVKIQMNNCLAFGSGHHKNE